MKRNLWISLMMFATQLVAQSAIPARYNTSCSLGFFPELAKAQNGRGHNGGGLNRMFRCRRDLGFAPVAK